LINEDILQTIGNTPLVRINKLNPNKNITIYANLSLNPTGSIKDRIALSMIQQAEISGKLIKGNNYRANIRKYRCCIGDDRLLKRL